MEILAFVASLDAEEQDRAIRKLADDDPAVAAEAAALVDLERSAELGDFLARPAELPDAVNLSRILHARSRSAEDAPTLPPIERIGSYTIEAVLGRGGMGTVYAATHDELGHRVAIKVPKRGLNSQGAVERFRREAQCLADLDHPAIARVLEAAVSGPQAAGGVPYIVMELVGDARPLTQHAREEGLDLASRLGLFLDACDAVAHGHERGVVHCDLKAGNILVDGRGRVKIVDFGIASVVAPDATSTTTQATATQVAGSLLSMSPEQALGGTHACTPRSDVYALGTVLYRLLTGASPFKLPSSGPTGDERDAGSRSGFSPASIDDSRPNGAFVLQEVLRTISDRRPAPVRRLAPECPRALETVALTALDPDAEERYADAGALAADLRRAMAGTAVMARPHGAWRRLVRSARRRRTPLSVLAFGAVIVAMASILTEGVLRPTPWGPQGGAVVWMPEIGVVAVGRAPTPDGGLAFEFAALHDGQWHPLDHAPWEFAWGSTLALAHAPSLGPLLRRPDDPRRPGLVIFGGTDGAGLRESVWCWTGQGPWVVAVRQDPIWAGDLLARDHLAHAAGWGRLWVHGGLVHDANVTQEVLGDLIVFDGTGWEAVRTATEVGPGPAPRHSHALAAAEDRRRLVLFGGSDGGLAPQYGRPEAPGLLDTWEYDIDAGTWSQALVGSVVAAPAPSIGFPATMAYDPDRGRAVLFTCDGRTWERSAGTGAPWSLVANAAAGGPGPRTGARLVWDGDARRVLIVGGTRIVGADGQPSGQVTADVLVIRMLDAWSLEGGRWTCVTTGNRSMFVASRSDREGVGFRGDVVAESNEAAERVIAEWLAHRGRQP